jgi:hypothetical protein
MPLVGRASLAVKQRDLLKEENAVLRAEQRELAREVIPLSAYLWRTAPDHKARAQAARVISIAQRIERRYDPDPAA